MAVNTIIAIVTAFLVGAVISFLTNLKKTRYGK
jgi:hypothetical protein